MREIKVNKNDGGQSLIKFLSKTCKNMPSSLMHKYIRNKCVKVNGVRVHDNVDLKEGDILSLYISDEFFGGASASADSNSFMKITPDITVVYEDDNILICDKPAGLIVHSDENEEYNTLINHIKAYLYRSGEYLPEKENSFAPALCNRIDRNTCGLVVAAKNATALKEMNLIFKERYCKKLYLCAVKGIVKSDTGKIDTYLTKNTETNTVTVSEKKTGSGSVNAITKYRVLVRNAEKDITLLEAELVTGRTHQIRAQFAYIGHPLVGDGKYSKNKDDKKSGYKFQALCSYSISFSEIPAGSALEYLNGFECHAKKPYFTSLF